MNILSENIKTFLTLLCSAGTEQNQDTYCACMCSMIFSYTVKKFSQLLILSALYLPSQAVICSPPWLAVREGLNLKYIYIWSAQTTRDEPYSHRWWWWSYHMELQLEIS